MHTPPSKRFLNQLNFPADVESEKLRELTFLMEINFRSSYSSTQRVSFVRSFRHTARHWNAMNEIRDPAFFRQKSPLLTAVPLSHHEKFWWITAGGGSGGEGNLQCKNDTRTSSVVFGIFSKQHHEQWNFITCPKMVHVIYIQKGWAARERGGARFF
jgi:hypothetical protein